MKKYGIFDLDGTLLNTLDDLADASNRALAAMGMPQHPVDAYRYFVGNGVAKLIERMTPEPFRNDPKILAQLRKLFNEWYDVHGKDLTRPYDGILEMLDGLLARGMKLAILSNKPHQFVTAMVPNYFGDRFAVIYGQREGYPTKPDGSLIDLVLKELGAKPEETVYLGDTSVDMETARNGKVFAVGVLWGFRTKEELLESGAQALIAKPQELFDLL